MSSVIPDEVIETFRILGATEEMIKDFEKKANDPLSHSITGKSGGDMVVVRGSIGNGISRVEISDDLIQMNDKDMLSDMVVSAVTSFYQNLQEWSTESAAKLVSEAMLLVAEQHSNND